MDPRARARADNRVGAFVFDTRVFYFFLPFIFPSSLPQSPLCARSVCKKLFQEISIQEIEREIPSLLKVSVLSVTYLAMHERPFLTSARLHKVSDAF
jgi:hypothetical protein